MTYQNDLGSVCPPAVLRPCVPRIKQNNQLHTFLVQAIQHLALVSDLDVYQQFTYVNLITPQPSSLPSDADSYVLTSRFNLEGFIVTTA